MQRTLVPIIITGIILFLDFYVYMGLKFLTKDLLPKTALIAKVAYWVFSIAIVASFWFLMVRYTGKDSTFMSKVLLCLVFVSMMSKLGGFIFLAIDDLIRGGQYLVGFFSNGKLQSIDGITRKSFLVKTGALVATSIAAGMTYGITRGSHRYQVIRQKLKIEGLPTSFAGLKILQISDIHSGSFWNKEAVLKGINQIMDEKADLVMFTGDLVNNHVSEMDDYIDVFSKITAPLGVYSILGNHDYGEYLPGFQKSDLPKNIADISAVHKKLGWDLLRNENRIIERNGEQFALVGVENWSNRMHFSRYGDLQKAVEGSEKTPIKLLMSHDPSHWKAEILKDFPEIRATFSGHTHGMQFGIETGGFKWSPVKYAYPEWAGLYTEGNQHLYVNRGFGYLGFPGRLGIWPEITVFELESA